jgi:hypothetical protein
MPDDEQNDGNGLFQYPVGYGMSRQQVRDDRIYETQLIDEWDGQDRDQAGQQSARPAATRHEAGQYFSDRADEQGGYRFPVPKQFEFLLALEKDRDEYEDAGDDPDCRRTPRPFSPEPR